MDYSEDRQDTWTRVDRLFTRALDLAPERRAAYLQAECGDDEELLTEVRSLLEAAGEMKEGFLGTPVLPLGEDTDELSAGLRIGPYRVVAEIGRGGMGKIFAAVRADDVYEQKVAIKVLKRGLDTEEIVRRFRAERRLLALLDHPNIVRILDGGTTENGLPYFVMEYVEGETIDRYCADGELSIRDRLALFREVCSAVGFAHQNLVIHRDLKPQNILVDARGEAKLLDFGIAKLLDADELMTRAGAQLMTPAYASPEQVTGGPVTTASDVYSLGRLLYEILTGRRALQPTIPDNPLSARAALDNRPDPPSREPGSRHLAGDLDSIVVKALAPDPRRRYPTVEQLVQDIDRYLGGQPVEARTSTFGYRMGKFLRRNRWSVLLGLLVSLGLMGVVGGVTAHQKALREQAKAEREGAMVDALHGFVDDFVKEDLDRSQWQRPIEVLDRYAEEVDLDAEQRSELARTMARMCHAREACDAEILLRESLRFHRRNPSTRPAELAAVLTDLAEVRLAHADVEGAEELLEEALGVLRSSGSSSRFVARAVNNTALLLKQAGRYEMAEQFYRESLAMRIRLYGDVHQDTARAQHNLGGLLRDRGRLDESEAMLTTSLASRSELFGGKSKDADTTRSSLALTLADQGRYNEAERLLRDVVATRRDLFGDGHPRSIGAVINLGFVLRLQERFDAADAEFQVAEDFYVEKGRQRTAAFANVLRHRALVRLGQGRADDAEALARRAVGIYAGKAGKETWRVAEAESVRGECLMELGQLEKARPLLQSSHATLLDVFGADARRTREAAQRLSELDSAS